MRAARFGRVQALEKTVDLLVQIRAEKMRRDLKLFVKEAWSWIEPSEYVDNWHIDAMCSHLMALFHGDIKNLIINIPPRHTKSLVADVLFPVWAWLQKPSEQFLCTSYSGDLSTRDAMKMRNLLESPWFRKHFGHIKLKDDDNLKTRYWNTNRGYRISTSVKGMATGEGGDILINDDPHNMKEIHSDVKRQDVIDWWDNVMRSRLNDPKTGRRLIIMQRGHEADLVGHLLKREKDQWVHLNLPMEYRPESQCVTFVGGKEFFRDPRTQKDELLNPKRFPQAEVDLIKGSMSETDYQAQYNQDPFGGGGRILKRNWWRKWPKEKPPECHSIIISLDTAFSEKTEADFSAGTIWGLFTHKELDPAYMIKQKERSKESIILLGRYNKRVAFPILRADVKELNKKHAPDWILIENKGSGISLAQELRRGGLPIKKIKVKADKITRAHISSLPLEKGAVWYMDKNWAEEVISQCERFPRGLNDDLVDTVTMAMMWLRRQGMTEIPDEIEDEIDLFTQKQRARSY